jgi:hypothetical protein
VPGGVGDEDPHDITSSVKGAPAHSAKAANRVTLPALPATRRPLPGVFCATLMARQGRTSQTRSEAGSAPGGSRDPDRPRRGLLQGSTGMPPHPPASPRRPGCPASTGIRARARGCLTGTGGNGLALDRFSVIYATPPCVISRRSPVQGSRAVPEHLCLTRPYVCP